MVGTTVTELWNLNAMGVIDSQGDMGQVVALNCQRQSEHTYSNEHESQSSNQIVLFSQTYGTDQLIMVFLDVK